MKTKEIKSFHKDEYPTQRNPLKQSWKKTVKQNNFDIVGIKTTINQKKSWRFPNGDRNGVL
jgi:hypothetical protein